MPGSDFTKGPPDSSDLSGLMYRQGKISSVDYKVNIDWWRAAWAIGVGHKPGKWSDGFKAVFIAVPAHGRSPGGSLP